jgi:hypothetical protein
VPKLNVLGPDAPERQVDLTDRDLRIGRDEQNDIVLPDSSKAVSRFHAELKFENGQYVLLDLNSQNGLWAGGRRLPRIALEPGVPVLVGSYRLVLDAPPAGSHAAPAAASTLASTPAASTAASSVPAGSPPGAAPSRPPDPPRPPEPARASEAAKPKAAAAPERGAASAKGIAASSTRFPKAVLFWGVAAVIVLGVIAVAVRGRISVPSVPAGSNPPSPPGVVAPPAIDQDGLRNHLTQAKKLLENNDPDAALTELDQVTQIDPSNAEASDLKARAQELKRPPPDPAPPSPPAHKPPPARSDLPSGPPPVLARKPGESQEEWAARDRQIAARYERAKAEVEVDFQAAIRDLGALQREEPNYLNVPSLLQRAQARARAAVQAAMDQAATLEMQGQLPEALQQYRRAQQVDPSTSGLEDSIRRVVMQMREEGTAAYNSATSYYMLARYPQAVPLLEKAVRLLPDGDPNKKIAQDRLDDIKRRQ